jgi:hypothetical protein
VLLLGFNAERLKNGEEKWTKRVFDGGWDET